MGKKRMKPEQVVTLVRRWACACEGCKFPHGCSLQTRLLPAGGQSERLVVGRRAVLGARLSNPVRAPSLGFVVGRHPRHE